MPTYPLPTLSATIDSTGIHAPEYNDILQSLKASFKLIYGDDAYLEPDSQDGQLLAVFALAIHDCNSNAISIYNGFRPGGALGAGLSSVVKINGIKRLVATYSTVDVVLTGVAGTTINNGVVSDDNGNLWSLPASVVMGIGGDVAVTATSQVIGDIAAQPGSVNGIYTPTRGWHTVSNPASAVQGAPVESDAELRARQTKSVSIPANSVFEAIYGGIANISGVSEVSIVENDTDLTDENGIPSHSIAAVVSGGNSSDIANEIALYKTPGTGTYGDISITTIDQNGVPNSIQFSRPTVKHIAVSVSITALAGYTDAIQTQAMQSIADYINSLPIGNDVYLSRIYEPVLSAGTTFYINSIQIGLVGEALGSGNITIAFDEVASCPIDDIDWTVL